MMFARCTICGLFAQLALCLTAFFAAAVDLRAQPPLTIPASPGFNPTGPGLSVPPTPPFETPQAATDRHGLAISIRSDFLHHFVHRTTVESDDVATRILEADVRGVQTTRTEVSMTTTASANSARMEILAQGQVQSDTVGYTRQAQVKTAGSHTFNIRKPVFFDGDQFSTKPAYGSLQARQFPQSVNTIASGIPLFGPIGNRIAWREVLRRMPASDAIVVRRVADDVLPKVNAGVDEELAKLNRLWSAFRQQITSALIPANIVWSASTTDQQLTILARNPAVTLPATQPLQRQLSTAETVSVLLADASVNALLNHERLQNLTLSDTDLMQLVTAIREREDLSDALSGVQQVLNNPSAPTATSIRLAAIDPISVAFDGGRISILIRLQFVPRAGPASDLQVIEVQLAGENSGEGRWLVVMNSLSARAADPTGQIAPLSNLINQRADFVVRQVPPTELPRQIRLSALKENLPSLKLRQVQTDSGWLRVSFDQSEAATTVHAFCPPK